MRNRYLIFLLFCCCFTLSLGTAVRSIDEAGTVPDPIETSYNERAKTPTGYDATSLTDWTQLSSGTTENLRDVHFVDADTGWAVGANGTIIKTNNGGENWVLLSSGVTTALRGVHFIDSNIGYVVGFPDQTATETVLITTDGGVTWTRISPSGFSEYFAVSIIGPNNGAVVGTNNGNGVALWPTGVSSFSFGIPAFNTTLRGVDFLGMGSTPGSAIGWAVGDGGIVLKSTSGGALWTAQTSPTTANLFSVSCADPNNCWAVGFNSIINTVNGGTTWTNQSFPQTPPLSLFHGVSFVDGNTGWVVGFNGVILHTINGGTDWSIQSSGTTENLNGVCFIDSQTGWAVGGEGVVLKYSSSVLPVTFLSFTGQLIEKQVQLDWQTASERNNAGFWVERSDDGTTWEALHFIAGAGTTLTRQRYTYLDAQTLPGISYYRLRQVDFDGRSAYSSIVRIDQPAAKRVLRVYPNPARGGLLQVNIPTEVAGLATQLTVYNDSGQLVETHTVRQPTTRLELGQLPPGIYTLVLSSDEKHWSARVVVD